MCFLEESLAATSFSRNWKRAVGWSGADETVLGCVAPRRTKRERWRGQGGGRRQWAGDSLWDSLWPMWEPGQCKRLVKFSAPHISRASLFHLLISISHRPDGSGWTRPLRLQVPVPWSKWTEVACRRPHCFLCTEHATSAGSLAWHWSSSKITKAGRVRPSRHCQSKSPLCCVM